MYIPVEPDLNPDGSLELPDMDEDLLEIFVQEGGCLLYTSDAADERSSVDLGGRRIIKKKTIMQRDVCRIRETRTDTRRPAANCERI